MKSKSKTAITLMLSLFMAFALIAALSYVRTSKNMENTKIFANTEEIANAMTLLQDGFNSAATEELVEAIALLQGSINKAWSHINETDVCETGKSIPAELQRGQYWAPESAHTDLINAINAAQAVLDYALLNSMTVTVNDISGASVHYSEIILFIDNVRSVHQIQNGVITIPVPVGSAVRFRVYAEGKGTVSRTINDFDTDVHNTQLVTLEDFKTTPMISAGNGHTLALREDGTVWSWGSNSFGQLGQVSSIIIPSRVLHLTNIIEISAGSGGDLSGNTFGHSVALRDDGTVWTWGNNNDGKLGDGTFISRTAPVQVDIEDVIAISAGGNHTVALKNDGTVWTWGSNLHGRLGNGGFLASSRPVRVIDTTNAFLDNVIAIAAGESHTLALKNNGTVWGWGNNTGGRIGDGGADQRIRAVQAQRLTSVIAISAGDLHSAALESDGRVWTWGNNNDGQLGNGTRSTPVSRVPFVVPNINNVTAISAGGRHTVIVLNNDTVMTWGRNRDGQLGINSSADDSTTPVTALNNNNVVSVAAGTTHTIALRNDGSVWSWGGNDFGQLGINTVARRLSSIRVLGQNAVGFLMLTLDNVGLISSPEAVDFGSITVGYSQRSARTVTITNISSTDITLNALPQIPNWTLTADADWTEPVATGAARTFTIRPNNGLTQGNYNVTITINGSNNTSVTIRTTFSVIPPQPPVIIRHPSNLTVEEGATASFMVIADSDPAASYQWQASINNGAAWSNVLWGESSTYTIQNVAGGLSGLMYRVMVSNIHGTTVSNAARLTVNRPPPIFIGSSIPLNRGENEWWRSNLHGSTGRIITATWNPPAGATGSVQVFIGNQTSPFITRNLSSGLLEINAAPGVTYRIRFLVNTTSFFQNFSYSIVSRDPS
jgi:alpha-tubulin suppressor-like RCC1 family protein